MLYETPVDTWILFDYAKTELSEDLGLVFSWPNKDPDTEGHKKRNAPGLRTMSFLLLFSTLHQKAEISQLILAL